uniref:Uncharacterized protein n=1 Tax=Anguilla anguilla TaxID=7936 RepID=A0A0E9SW44_ANGAN
MTRSPQFCRHFASSYQGLVGLGWTGVPGHCCIIFCHHCAGCPLTTGLLSLLLVYYLCYWCNVFATGAMSLLLDYCLCCCYTIFATGLLYLVLVYGRCCWSAVSFDSF